MTQLNFTLDKDFFIGLFSKGREDAFGELVECMLNQFIQAESAEKLNAVNYQRTDGRTDYRNGVRQRQINMDLSIKVQSINPLIFYAANDRCSFSYSCL